MIAHGIKNREIFSNLEKHFATREQFVTLNTQHVADGITEPMAKITFRSALIYEKALRSFSKSRPPLIASSAFTRILQSDHSDLPPAQFTPMRDGQDLGFRHYAANSEKALVLLHGSACFGDHFHPLAKELSHAHIAQVYTLNLRGHGFTPGERGHSVQHPGQIIEDVEDFLRYLKRQNPRVEITLGGHSAGGGVVLAIARTLARTLTRSPAENLVAKYIFIAPFLGMGSSTVRPYFGGWITKLHALKIRSLVALNLLGLTRWNHSTVIEFGIEACAPDPRYIGSWSLNTALAFGPGPWVMNQILLAKPTLLIAGDADEVFFSHLYKEAFTQIASNVDQPNLGPIGHFDVLVDSAAINAIANWMR